MARTIAILTAGTLLCASFVHAQAEYPPEALERYAECMERNDVQAIKDLVWAHQNVEPIDATIYGLPRDDFDDGSLLTIEERLWIRAAKAAAGIQLPTSGPLQYPHHLRAAIDRMYRIDGDRPDCSEILSRTGVRPPEQEGLGGGWSSDRNLTADDNHERGEVDIAVDYANPNRIMVSAVSTGGSDSSNFIASSGNWGQSWNTGVVGNNSSSSWECDPVSYYQRSTGKVYHSKVACNDGYCSSWTRLLFRHSDDNGVSWSDCGGRPGLENSEDRQWHVVDNTPSSACYGNIYVTWHNLNQQKVARSTDDCSSWSGRNDLTDIYSAISPDINLAADGHAYVVWQNYRPSDRSFKLAGSDDCGASWTSPPPSTVKPRLGDWKNYIPAQCKRGVPTQPTVDVDRSPQSEFHGRVYMAMFDFNQSGCGNGPGCDDWTSDCNYDVWFSYSDDEGLSWSPAVNLTAGDGNRVDHFMGYMRVDETDGSIYIGYHRSRLNPSSLADRQKTHFCVLRSIDGGQSWSEFQASTLEGDEAESGGSTFERGDYNKVDVYGGVVWPAWIDRRESAAEEEVVVRKICSEPSHWSERSPTFTAPAVTVAAIGDHDLEILWTVPDLYWGDGDEDPSGRHFQLWVDGELAEDHIPATAEQTIWSTDDLTVGHSFMVRAVNQCGVAKDYRPASYAAPLFADSFECGDTSAWSFTED